MLNRDQVIKKQVQEELANTVKTVATNIYYAPDGKPPISYYDPLFDFVKKIKYVSLSKELRNQCFDLNENMTINIKLIGMKTGNSLSAEKFFNFLSAILNDRNAQTIYDVLADTDKNGDNLLTRMSRAIRTGENGYEPDSLFSLLALMKNMQQILNHVNSSLPYYGDAKLYQLMNTTNAHLETLGYYLQNASYDEFFKATEIKARASESNTQTPLRTNSIYKPAVTTKIPDEDNYNPNIFIRDFP